MAIRWLAVPFTGTQRRGDSSCGVPRRTSGGEGAPTKPVVSGQGGPTGANGRASSSANTTKPARGLFQLSCVGPVDTKNDRRNRGDVTGKGGRTGYASLTVPCQIGAGFWQTGGGQSPPSGLLTRDRSGRKPNLPAVSSGGPGRPTKTTGHRRRALEGCVNSVGGQKTPLSQFPKILRGTLRCTKPRTGNHRGRGGGRRTFQPHGGQPRDSAWDAVTSKCVLVPGKPGTNPSHHSNCKTPNFFCEKAFLQLFSGPKIY